MRLLGLLSPLAVRVLQIRAQARQEPARPAHEVVAPVPLAVLAHLFGLSPLTMTLGTDLGPRWPGEMAIWHAVAMAHQDGAPSGKAGLICKLCLKAFRSLVTSVCNLWVRICA